MDQNNPVNKLLDLLCFTPAGLIALAVLFVLPLIPPFNQAYLLRWLIRAAFIQAMARRASNCVVARETLVMEQLVP